ncbi:MAG: methyltransferase domain-containing protein [Acidobacteriota bacterium]
MRLRVTFRSSLIITVAGLSLLIALVVLTTGDALLKLDYGRIHDRAAWQLPDRVIENLEIETGDRIADIGAGAGYFTFRLADRVGPSGKVFAVDVDDDVVGNLRAMVEREGRTNVEVILGKADDPLLPVGEVDLILLCNAYHHINNRPAYFARLRGNLNPPGRVALIDMKPGPLTRLFVPSGHWTDIATMRDEMHAAGYRMRRELSFLPFQNFILFEGAQP